jgi:hypothetical protein
MHTYHSETSGVNNDDCLVADSQHPYFIFVECNKVGRLETDGGDVITARE